MCCQNRRIATEGGHHQAEITVQRADNCSLTESIKNSDPVSFSEGHPVRIKALYFKAYHNLNETWWRKYCLWLSVELRYLCLLMMCGI